jgi:SAM-dependent methyltransferase
MTQIEKQAGYADTGWWRNHFSGILLDLWQSIVPGEQAARDADFLQAHWELPPAAQILDVPCGEGRVALELAGRNFRLVGVDISAGLIQAARQQSEQQQLPVEWYEGDMRALPWNQAFDAAYCWGDSFGYLDEQGNQDFLQAAYRALRPSGWWAMEIQMIAEVLLPRFRHEEAGEVDGIRVRVERAYDPRHGRLTVKYALERSGVQEQRVASYRVYSCAEVCRRLEQARFEIVGLFGANGEPFQLGSDRLRIIGRRAY